MLFGKFCRKKIQRQEVLELLREEIEKVQEKKIVELIQEKKKDEIAKIYEEINVAFLETFIKKQRTILELHDSEIPKYTSIETIFVLSRSGCTDFELFYDIEDFKFLLIAEGGEVGACIADILDTKDVCNLTLNNFMLM